jgi:hypothetical protein
MIGPLKIDLFTNFNVGYHHGWWAKEYNNS